MRLLSMGLILVLLVFHIPAYAGSLYQYTDYNGNLWIVDDPANVPEDLRERVRPLNGLDDSSETLVPVALKPETPETAYIYIPDDQAAITTKSLAQEEAALEKLLTRIRQVKAISVNAPPNAASPGERRAHEQEVRTLNSLIEQYFKKRAIFEEKVELYNAGIRM